MFPLLILSVLFLVLLTAAYGCWKVRHCWQKPLSSREKVVVGISAGVMLLAALWFGLVKVAKVNRAKPTAVKPSQAEPSGAEATAAELSRAEAGRAELSHAERSWAKLSPNKPSRTPAGYSKKDREEYERRWQAVYQEVGPPPDDDCVPVLGYKTAQGVEYASHWRRMPNSTKKDNLKP